MLLRGATEADLPEIVGLVNAAFRGSEGWTVEEKYIEGERITLPRLRADLAAKPEAQLLTWRDEADGQLLGSVWLEPVGGAVWYMGLLCVRPERQDRQLGRTMLEAVEESARERGARRIRISVINVRGKLLAWYKRRGYMLTGETKPFPYDEKRVGKPLRDDLVFWVMEKAV